MFAKPNSSCSTAKSGSNDQGSAAAQKKKGGKKSNKKSNDTSMSTSNSSIDTPLRKSDIRNLKQAALSYFCDNLPARGQEGEYDEQRQPREELLSAVLSEVFATNQIASRQLHHAELGRLTLYTRTPNANQEKSKSEDVSLCWPYVNTQVIWIKQPPKPNTNQLEVSIPTVALLSVLPPESMPTVYIASAASKFLCRGAHLMRAGMLNLPTIGNDNQEQQESKKPASLLLQASIPRPVAIAVTGNPQPMAVGLIHDGVKSTSDIGPATKGIGALIWNCYGDDIWQQQINELQTLASVTEVIGPMGGASYNEGHYGNVGFVSGERVLPIVKNDARDQEGDQQVATSAWDSNESDAVEAASGEEKVSDSREETTNERPEESPTENVPELAPSNEEQTPPDADEDDSPSQEDLLHQAVCKALLISVSPKDLPMTVANFYANHVLPNRPEGTTIQLKQTKYKKFGNYLQEQVKRKLLALGPGPNKNSKDRTGYIMSFDKRHTDLLSYKSDHAEEVQDAKETAQAAAATKQQKLVLVNLFVVPHHFVALLRLNPDDVKAANASSTERAGTGMLTLPEVRNLLESYLTREDLINFDEVQIDGPLFDALYKKKKQANDGTAVTNDTTTVSRKDLSEQWVAAMNPAYAIVQMPGNRVQRLGKGQPPKVQVEVSMRQSKKFVTKIRGMETYGVNGTLLAKDIGKRLACQATVETQSEKGPALPKGYVEIVLGGNFADEIEALLLGDEKLCPSHGGIKNSDYKLPKGSIDVVLRKGVPPRKKRGGGKKR